MTHQWFLASSEPKMESRHRTAAQKDRATDQYPVYAVGFFAPTWSCKTRVSVREVQQACVVRRG